MKKEIKIINGHKVKVIKDPNPEPYEDIPDNINLDWSQAILNPYVKEAKKSTLN